MGRYGQSEHDGMIMDSPESSALRHERTETLERVLGDLPADARVALLLSAHGFKGGPKTLQRSGATWDSVTIGPNRMAYAVASEPEPNDAASVTILGYAPNGTLTWKTTVIEP